MFWQLKPGGDLAAAFLSPAYQAILPYVFAIAYHGMGFRSPKNPPFGLSFEGLASHTSVSAASSGERGAPEPPISVLTQPRHMGLTFTFPASPATLYGKGVQGGLRDGEGGRSQAFAERPAAG
jgi:hypothetical protein